MQPTAVAQFQGRLFEEVQLLHNQLTSLPSNDTRIRTAQGLKNGAPSCPSFWIERRVLSDEVYAELAAAEQAAAKTKSFAEEAIEASKKSEKCAQEAIEVAVEEEGRRERAATNINII